MGIYVDLPELGAWHHVIRLNHTEEDSLVPPTKTLNAAQATPTHSAVRDEKKLRRVFRNLAAALEMAPVKEEELRAIVAERVAKAGGAIPAKPLPQGRATMPSV